MECGFYSTHQWSVPMSQNFYPVNQVFTSASKFSRLQHEKDILENGLANCVTYLGVLRKKQARTERCLSAGSSMPRKKRKKIQHSKREIEREITNRELEEQALLTNLQACKTNIYLLETQSLPSTAVSSTVPDLVSNSTRCSIPESELTEPNWNGWGDEAVVSPFQKRSSNPFFADDIAPDDCPEGRAVEELMDTDPKLLPNATDRSVLRIQPNTVCSQSMLSPEATVFEPHRVHLGQRELVVQHLAELHTSSSLAIKSLQIKALQIKALEIMEQRRLTDAGIVRESRQGSLQPIAEEAYNQSWADTTPQRCYMENIQGGQLKRTRTHSL